MVAQSNQSRQMSVTEFMSLPDDGNRHELVRGELRVVRAEGILTDDEMLPGFTLPLNLVFPA